jgi:hypothetical protein
MQPCPTKRLLGVNTLAARLTPHPAPKELRLTPFWYWTIGAGLGCGDAEKKRLKMMAFYGIIKERFGEGQCLFTEGKDES